jgi:hypothetical protein
LFLALLAGTQASAEQLTLDRIHGDSSLSGPGVRSLKVSPDGARVTFLRGRDDNQFQLDLWEYNLKDKSTHRLVDSKILVSEEKLSDAEKARRERERIAAFKGILNYSWSPDGKRLLVPIAGNLYLVDVASRTGAPGRLGQCARSENFAARPLRVVRARPEPVRDRAEQRQGKAADHRRQGHHPQRRSRIRGAGRNGPDHRLLLGAGRFRHRLQALRRKPGADRTPL